MLMEVVGIEVLTSTRLNSLTKGFFYRPFHQDYAGIKGSSVYAKSFGPCRPKVFPVRSMNLDITKTP